jgi:RNA polymerase sigma factor (TIGR02999 family)
METPSSQEITQLLVAWRNGDKEALEKLSPLVYRELHRLAGRFMRRERAGHTLQTTALVNEAFVRLIDWQHVEWRDRAHFFGVSASLMRHILVKFARDRGYAKRGGGLQQVSLSEAAEVSTGKSADLVALDDALNGLAALSPRQSQVVELRFFGGLSIEETAEALRVSPITVRRDWSLAQAFLQRELSKSVASGK